MILEENYRFSAQSLLDSNSLKAYTYYYTKDKFVLLHAAEYKMDRCDDHKKSIDLGLNKVYSPGMERELIFQCRLICQTENKK